MNSNVDNRRLIEYFVDFINFNQKKMRKFLMSFK